MFGKSIIEFLAFYALGVAAPVYAQSATSPQAAPSASDWVSLKDRPDGILVINVMVNGMPASAVIDTGSPGVVLNRRFAASLHLDTRAIGKAYSVGGLQAFGVADHVGLTIAKHAFPTGSMQVADFTEVEGALGRPIDVVIGAALIASTGLVVDYDDHRVAFTDHRSSDYVSKIPITIDRNAMRITISAPVDGALINPVLLDTGSSSSLTLAKRAYLKISSKIKNKTDIEMVGGGGEELQTIFTLPELNLGTESIQNISAQVENEGFLAHNDLAGSIGSELMSRFNFAISPSSQSLYLSKARGGYTPSAKSTVGIQADYRPDRIIISHIMSGSPAQAAGLKDGDEICAVNGVKVFDGWVRSPMRDWGTRAPGLKYLVSLCSGRSISLTSAQFY